MPDSRRRRPGVHVRAGSVRQARIEAGLSLAEVAAGRLTRNAIHLVETGRSRPSMETLQLIAERTGRPLDYFLADAPSAAAEDWAGDHQAVIELETMLARGELEDAIAAGKALLQRVGSGEVAGTVRLRLAEAYCRRHDAETALELLALARPALQAAGDEWLLIECLDWEAAALHLQEDPRALTLLEEARSRAKTMDPVPAGLLARIETHLASLHVRRHAWAQAARAFEAALAHSSSMLDLVELARIHQGLGHAYQQIGQPGKALTHASKALAISELSSELRLRLAAEANLGDLLMKQGKFERAEEHLRRALDRIDDSAANRRTRAQIMWVLAEVELSSGKDGEAVALGLETLAVATQEREPVVTAGALQVVATAYERMGRSQEADRDFEQALEILGNLDQPLRLRDAHMAYAELLEARGDLGAAVRHWRVAAELGRDAGPAPIALDGTLLRAAAG